MSVSLIGVRRRRKQIDIARITSDAKVDMRGEDRRQEGRLLLRARMVSSIKKSSLKRFVDRLGDYYGLCLGFDDRTRCGRIVERGTRYCEYHVCEIRECRDPRAPSFEYCGNHRCVVSGCHRTRKSSIPSCRRNMDHGIEGQFCDGHACSQVGCCNRVVEDTGWCFEHGRCRASGYRLGPDAGEDEAGCRGYRRRRTGWGGHQRGRDGDGERRVGWGENREGRSPWEAWGITM